MLAWPAVDSLRLAPSGFAGARTGSLVGLVAGGAGLARQATRASL